MPFRLLNRNGDLTVSVLDLAAVSLYETLCCHSTSSQPYLVGDGDPSGKPIKMLKKGGGGGGGEGEREERLSIACKGLASHTQDGLSSTKNLAQEHKTMTLPGLKSGPLNSSLILPF